MSSHLPFTHKNNSMPGFFLVGGGIKPNLANEALIKLTQIASESEHLTGFAIHHLLTSIMTGNAPVTEGFQCQHPRMQICEDLLCGM